jgi:serine beta-lactamase-like protein LACTB
VSMSRTEMKLALIVVVVGLVPAAILGWLWYLSATAPLHEQPQNVPSTSLTPPAAQWSSAAERGRQVIRTALIEQNLPGLSVAVGIGGTIVWAEGAGWADLDKRVAVTPETRFRIGTASIALTSAAVGLLVEQHRLALDSEIQAYVPSFPKKPSPITLRHLMGHTSGIRNDGGDESPLFGRRCARPVEAIDEFADDPLRFEPGTAFRFSSYGWILVSAALEAAAGEPFVMSMQKQIFDPLGMEHTRPDSTTEPVAGLSVFYFPRFAADPRYGLHLMREIDLSCYAGASVFLSTPSDMARFAMAMNSGRLLQPPTVETLRANQRLPTGEYTGYGLGWDRETETVAGKDTPIVGHDGSTLGGMVSSVWTFPEHGISVSVMSNISYADTAGVAVKLAETFLDGKRTAVGQSGGN